MRPAVLRSSLKSSERRSVHLEVPRRAHAERAPSGAAEPPVPPAPEASAPAVVKRFHARGLVGRLRDRLRARREFAGLALLSARGASVPRPRELRRGERGWEVVMEHVEDAVALDALVTGEAEWPVAPARVAPAVGALLAQLHAAGLDHADLDPGNLLVDRAGRAWLIDFQRSRRRAPSARRAVRDLAVACAGVRERVDGRFRARAFLTWWRALPPALRRRLPARAALVEAVEARARALRRDLVRRHRDRWTRASGLCRTVAGADGERLERIADRGGGREVVAARGAAARSVWVRAGRLCEHAVAAPRPRRLERDAEPRAVLVRAESARPLALAEVAGAGPGARRRVARALGELLGTLHDRGLRPRGLRAVDLSLEGGAARPRATLAPTVRLARLDPRPGAVRPPAARWAGLAGDLVAAWRSASPLERRAFAAAYRAAFRGTREERHRLAAELRG